MSKRWEYGKANINNLQILMQLKVIFKLSININKDVSTKQ
jgi:hypothetical protein